MPLNCSCRKMISRITLFTLLAQMSLGQDVKITAINSTSGLYYEKIGQVYLSNSQWKFITSIDYKGYLLFYEYLHQQATKLQDFCDAYKLDMCKDRLIGINTALSRIDKTDEEMTGFIGIRKEKRVRRFWGALVGFFAGAVSSLFGGGTDMSQYDNAIAQLQSGQAQIIDKINMQTTLFKAHAEVQDMKIDRLTETQNNIKTKIADLENTVMEDLEEKEKQINNLKSLLQETTQQLEEQGTKIKELIKNVEDIKAKLVQVDKTLERINGVLVEHGHILNETNLKVELNSLTIDFTFLFDQFESEQNKLFAVVKKAHEGKLDTYILRPLDLINMLQDIHPKLPEGEMLPFFPKIENARHLYNLIKSKVNFYNYTLYFTLQMPLVNFKTFDFFKLTSMPVKVKESLFAFILPKEPFLVVDKNNHEYLTMHFEDYHSFCKEIEKDKLLCEQSRPLLSTSSDQPCETELLTSSKQIPENCDIRLINVKDLLLLQIQEQKSWIYVTPKGGSQISVTCDVQRQSILLEGSGFASLSDNCKMRYNQNGIESLEKFTAIVQSNYTPSINLLNFINPSNYENQLPPPTTGQKYKNLILPFDLKELATISTAINSNPSNLNYLYFIILLPVFIIVIVVAVLIYKKKINLDSLKHFFSKKQNNENKKRQESTECSDDEEKEKFKFKLKMRNKHEKISALSIHSDPSANDPEAEYLSVRVKVKKNPLNEKNNLNNANVSEKVVSKVLLPEPTTPEEDDIYQNSETIKEDNYLKNLRKFKPAKKP